MALEKMTENVEIVQTLSTYPNQEDGLSAEELKAKFDAGAKAIKEYLNGKVVPAVQELERVVDPGMAYGLDTTLTISGRAADAAAVGAALASKRPNTWLPTIEEIGAAPAGYGLGTSLPEVAHADNATKPGFYFTRNGHPFDYGIATIFVVGGTGDVIPVKMAFGISMNPTTENAIAICNTDGIWEWLNPPMKLGVEYRTVERYEGKPVYAKLINYGAMPAEATATIPHNISGAARFVSCDAMFFHPNNGNGSITMPRYYADTNRQFAAVVGANIEVHSAVDVSSYTCYVMVKYTKSSD